MTYSVQVVQEFYSVLRAGDVTRPERGYDYYAGL